MLKLGTKVNHKLGSSWLMLDKLLNLTFSGKLTEVVVIYGGTIGVRKGLWLFCTLIM